MPSDQDKKLEEYVKPRLRIIELAAEEVLGTGCKTVSGSAVGAVPCHLNNCVNSDTS
jgi:hypothetical protein